MGGHVGIYDGNGGYIASNTKTGIHQGSMAEADIVDLFKGISAPLNTLATKQSTKTMDSEAKAVLRTVCKS